MEVWYLRLLRALVKSNPAGQEVPLFKRQSGPDPDSDGQASCPPTVINTTS